MTGGTCHDLGAVAPWRNRVHLGKKYWLFSKKKTTAVFPVLQYACLIFLGGFGNGKQKDLRRLHQPWQRGLLHEVQATQKRIPGFVC